MTNLIVKKYGGMTLSDPEKIKAIALQLAEGHRNGNKLIVVVSAMGKTTDNLVELAQKISTNPNARELDMLLTVGERISMSLLSMALLDLGIPAISLTGSQAGILTTESHSNAMITQILSARTTAALEDHKIVIVAGFQGVSALNKEITTLGRGGSDTSAVALASLFKAQRCEILKEVPNIFSADPNIVPQAVPLESLHYDELLEMTFWGAKVLHYRSAELAALKKVPLWIGPAHANDRNHKFIPTRVTLSNQALLKSFIYTKDNESMFESQKILGINGHKKILCVQTQNHNPAQALEHWSHLLEKHQIPQPQVLHLNMEGPYFEIYLTSSTEGLKSLTSLLPIENYTLKPADLCSITLTLTGNSTATKSIDVLKTLETNTIPCHKVFYSALSLTLILNQPDFEKALQLLHGE